MKYTYLGRTGLKVSRLCLGTVNFGWVADAATGHAIMDRALDEGINFFDTANVYNLEKGEEGTERIIGRWFAQGGGRREKVVLATKLYGDVSKWPNDGRCSALHIKRACEASLKRLQTDYIDLYQMHHIDRNTPWEEVWQAMEQLVHEGKVLYVGSSNFSGWHIAQANEIARSRNFMGLVSEQSLYNLVERSLELEVLPACESYGVGVLPWSPLVSGLLGGVLKKIEGGRRAQENVRERVEHFRPQLEKYEAFCEEIGEEPAAVALAWLLHQPLVTAPILGPRTVDQLTGASLRSLEIDFTDEQLAKLDEIWPGYKTAPEHYAW